MMNDTVTLSREVVEQLVQLASDGCGAYDLAPYACDVVETVLGEALRAQGAQKA